jgi:hypothetical protein
MRVAGRVDQLALTRTRSPARSTLPSTT